MHPAVSELDIVILLAEAPTNSVFSEIDETERVTLLTLASVVSDILLTDFNRFATYT